MSLKSPVPREMATESSKGRFSPSTLFSWAASEQGSGQDQLAGRTRAEFQPPVPTLGFVQALGVEQLRPSCSRSGRITSCVIRAAAPLHPLLTQNGICVVLCHVLFVSISPMCLVSE